MGKMIAASPIDHKISYSLKNTDFKIGSPEELSYYINKYPELSEDYLYDTGLAGFFSEKLNKPEIGRKLLEAINTNAPIQELVNICLLSCNYLTGPEMTDVLKRLSDMRASQRWYKIKKKADCYFEIRDYKNAVAYYKNITENSDYYGIPEHELGDVWHNAGISVLKTEGYENAAICFKKAYMHNGRVQSLTAYLECFRIMGDEREFDTAISELNVPEDVKGRIEQKMSDTKADFAYSDEMARLDRVNLLLKENKTEEFWKEIKAFCGKIKEEYIKNNG